MSDVLHTFSGVLDPLDRTRMLDEPGWQPGHAVPVRRPGGTTIPLDASDALMDEMEERSRRGLWAKPEASDQWLAPRLHWALRLTRAEAADQQMWLWFATRHPWYLSWRWGGGDGIAENRWRGAVNKQAFARLWWGGELFRDGPDYERAVRAFVRQDLPNSYLHRTMVRCRPLAVALVDVMVAREAEGPMTADEVNDVARAVNVALAGEPPEAALGYPVDDPAAYLRWVSDAPRAPYDWDSVPSGPDDRREDGATPETARAIAERCASYAPMTAAARRSRSHRRRTSAGEVDSVPAEE